MFDYNFTNKTENISAFFYINTNKTFTIPKWTEYTFFL